MRNLARRQRPQSQRPSRALRSWPDGAGRQWKTSLTGEWQQVILLDFDTRPRRRTIICTIITVIFRLIDPELCIELAMDNRRGG